MNTAKLHHFNPQFVLRGFADGNQRITTIRLPERKARTTRVRETAAENHLYSLPGHPSGADIFEKALGAGIEADVADIFARIEGGEWPLSRDPRDTLAEFIALQVLRGPEQRQRMESASSDLFLRAAGQLGRDGLTRFASDAAGREVSEAEVDELWNTVATPDGAQITYLPRDHIEMMGEVTESIAAAIAARPWKLIRFSRRALVTCDAPVTPVPYDTEGPFIGNGIATARFVLYPISRRMGLVMSHALDRNDAGDDLNELSNRARSGSLDNESAGTTAVEKLMNEHTAAHAIRNIYHHPDDPLSVPEAYREGGASTSST
ncbi:DUF4238 domain-containing protein [Salinibacterium sp. PAMC 21357]|uniref:DUF4238 domain-containing protein n=1 Tax=Salinibacterium sp. PAMC 21357 TaxID=1112215 RepID=UPI00028A1E62|nr:DUF4238 domain-containing protein [Salinibacterium sp. PAMC 21357]